MAKAKDVPPTPPAAPSKPTLPRRCAKCAVPKPASHFQASSGLTPYCTSCRGRFPSLADARIVAGPVRPVRAR